ncbi:MAG: hypothetical protein CMI26_11495 [Opitutae bacterium]|nr:hypothetical protein [Opitutae bacterium]
MQEKTILHLHPNFQKLARKKRIFEHRTTTFQKIIGFRKITRDGVCEGLLFKNPFPSNPSKFLATLVPKPNLTPHEMGEAK